MHARAHAQAAAGARRGSADALRRLRRQGRTEPVSQALARLPPPIRRRPGGAGGARRRRVSRRRPAIWSRRSISSAPSSTIRSCSARSRPTMRSTTCSRWAAFRVTRSRRRSSRRARGRSRRRCSSCCPACAPASIARMLRWSAAIPARASLRSASRHRRGRAGPHLRKGGLDAGDALILTRPIGTGMLFAAAMRARREAAWIEAALAEMRRSNRRAAAILHEHGATAMTDVSGFGLIGHLGEMLAASLAGAELDLAAVPLYAGALELAQPGSLDAAGGKPGAASLLRGEIDAALRAAVRSADLRRPARRRSGRSGGGLRGRSCSPTDTFTRPSWAALRVRPLRARCVDRRRPPITRKIPLHQVEAAQCQADQTATLKYSAIQADPVHANGRRHG